MRAEAVILLGFVGTGVGAALYLLGQAVQRRRGRRRAQRVAEARRRAYGGLPEPGSTINSTPVLTLTRCPACGQEVPGRLLAAHGRAHREARERLRERGEAEG